MPKNNDKMWKLARIVITVGTILVAVAIAYGTLRERVNTNKDKIESVEKKADSNQQAIIEMRTNIKYIKEGIDEIKEQLR